MAKRTRYTEVGRKVATLGKQYDLAKVINVSQQAISAKMRGESDFTTTELAKLARHYKVPVFYFVTPESVTVELSRQLGNCIKDLPKIKRMIINWIKN